MTLEEIAHLAGVSRSTVSRVINDHPSVSPDVRERVWAVIREREFQPNSAARALVNRRSQIIGLVIPQAINSVFSDPYFPILIRGIAAACDARDYYLMLSLPTAQTSDAHRRLVRGGHLDGMIVASAFIDDSFVKRLRDDAFPFVLVGRQPHHPQISTVDADNVRGATMAVQHLARLGYTRIATITGPLNMIAAIDRREGFEAALRATGLPRRDDYILEGDFSEESGFHAMRRLLTLGESERPQAIFAASDMMAIGALRAVRAAGLQVPDDIALVGFDDIPLATAVEPPLTTVRQPIEQLGYTAATILIEMLAGVDGRGTPQRIVLPTELVIRDSCGQSRLFRASTLRRV